METVKVFVNTEEVGYVELPKIDMNEVYSLCIWDKWLNEKPSGVYLEKDITCTNKEDVIFNLDNESYKYDSDSFGWVNVLN